MQPAPAQQIVADAPIVRSPDGSRYAAFSRACTSTGHPLHNASIEPYVPSRTHRVRWADIFTPAGTSA